MDILAKTILRRALDRIDMADLVNCPRSTGAQAGVS